MRGQSGLWVWALVMLSGSGVAVAQERYGEDLGPEPTQLWEGNFDYSATAGTLLSCSDLIGLSVCEGINSSSASIQGVPEGVEVVQGYLIWTASKEYMTPNDMEVTLTLPGGAPTTVMAEEDDFEVVEEEILDPFGNLIDHAGWFTARADITELLEEHRRGGGDLNGGYTVGDLRIAHGSLQDPTSVWVLGSLAVGGWSVLMFYRLPNQTTFRKIFYYTGLEFLSGGNVSLRPSGFEVPGEPRARLTVHVLEGDSNLTGDGLTFNGNLISDSCNPANNIFNDTINTSSGGACRTGQFGVDLDTFDVSAFLRPQATEATVEFSVPNEQIFTNYMVVSFDSLPEFLKPTKTAIPRPNTEVSVGDLITYTISIWNRGEAPASSVTVTDAIPEGTVYVARTTTVDDDINAADPSAGVSPLQAGLVLDDILGGPIPPGDGPESQHTVSFQVEVIRAPSSGMISNTATLSATGIPPVLTNTASHPVRSEAQDAGTDAADPPQDTSSPPQDTSTSEQDTATPDLPEQQDTAASPCGPGTIFENNRCVPICGEGTVWNEGLCVIDDNTTEVASNTADDGGCGCQSPTTRPRPTGRLMFALLACLTALTWRRR